MTDQDQQPTGPEYKPIQFANAQWQEIDAVRKLYIEKRGVKSNTSLPTTVMEGIALLKDSLNK